MKTSRLLGTICACFISTSIHAATFYTSETAWDANNVPFTEIDFEGVAPAGSFASIPANQYPGVTFNSSRNTIASATYTNSNFPGTSPSDFFFVDLFKGSLGLTFNPEVDAIGFYLSLGSAGSADSGGEATLKIFDGATLLNTTNVTASGLSAFNTFVGWDGLGDISNLNISIASSSNWIAIDDLKFAAVPVPAAVWLFGSGLIGLIGLARRKA